MSKTLRTSTIATQFRPRLIWIDMAVSKKNHKQFGLTHHWRNTAKLRHKKPYLIWGGAAGAGCGGGGRGGSGGGHLHHGRVDDRHPGFSINGHWFSFGHAMPCPCFEKGISNKYAKGSHLTFLLDFGFPIIPNTAILTPPKMRSRSWSWTNSDVDDTPRSISTRTWLLVHTSASVIFPS